MKIAWVVAVGLLCGIAGTNAVHGQGVEVGDADPTGGLAPKVRVVFHEGAVLGIGVDSLLTYRPETGSIVVQYADGQVVEGLVDPLPASSLTSDTGWVHEGVLVGLHRGRAKAGCSSQLSTLNAAIAAASSACQAGSGQTLACSQARALMQTAFSNYNDCIGRLIQEK